MYIYMFIYVSSSFSWFFSSIFFVFSESKLYAVVFVFKFVALSCFCCLSVHICRCCWFDWPYCLGFG